MVQIYLLSIILVLLPPFVLFNNPVIGTHSISKIIWGSLLLYQFIYHRKDIFILWEKNKKILSITLFFLLSQLLSIFYAKDIVAFFYGFEDFLFGYLFFINSLLLVNKVKSSQLLKLLTISLSFDLVSNWVLILYPNIFFKIFQHLLSSQYLLVIKQEFERNRLGLENFNFVVLALFLFLIIKENKNTLQDYFLLIVNGFLVAISNFRTKSVLLITSIFFTLVLLRKKAIYLFIFFAIVGTMLVANFRLSNFRVNVANRYKNNKTNIASVVLRFDAWRKSTEILANNQYHGIGLGNYKYYVRPGMFNDVKKDKSYYYAIYNDPHSKPIKVLVETGIIGIFFYLIMMGYFIYSDVLFFKKNSLDKNIYSVCFWILVLFSLYNPTEMVKYQMLFWFFRAKITV